MGHAMRGGGLDSPGLRLGVGSCARCAGCEAGRFQGGLMRPAPGDVGDATSVVKAGKKEIGAHSKNGDPAKRAESGMLSAVQGSGSDAMRCQVPVPC